MPFVPAPNIVQIEYRCTMDNQQVENRHFINNFGPPTPAELQAFASGGWSWWDLTYSPLISDAVTLREVVATDMSTQNGEQYTYAPNTETTGQAAGGSMPNEVAFCISLRSGARGRSARGRWYVFGIPRGAQQTTNNMSAAAAEALRAALQTRITALGAANKPMTIVSYFSNGGPRPGGPVYFLVNTATIVDTTFDSQRRRKPGVGS
jgi:hypothetical protein